MVREEYLNIDFMYKFINTLCRRDGYILSEFDFGMLTHNKIDDIAWTLQNGHGYNMVYKFKAYKIPDIKLKETKHWIGSAKNLEKYFILDILKSQNDNYDQSRYNDLKKYFVKTITYEEVSKQLLKKIKQCEFCFDLSSETITDYDAKKTTFVKNPPFFRLNNQTYYAIYNQPEILKYHFSRAREYKKEALEETNYKNRELLLKYMETMDLYQHNLIDIKTMCAKLSKRWDNQPIKAEEYEKLIYKDSYSRKATNVEKLLSIHDDDAPIFYTDNTLELNAPLVNSINKVAAHSTKQINMIKQQIKTEINYNLRNIDVSLKLMADSIKKLSFLQLQDLPDITIKMQPLAFWQLDLLYPIIDKKSNPGALLHRPNVEELLQDYNFNCYRENVNKKIINDTHMLKRNTRPCIDITPEQATNAEIESVKIYAKIQSELQKLTPETMSVDSLVNISRLLNKTTITQPEPNTR